VVFFEFIEYLPLICDGFIAAQGLATSPQAKHLDRAVARWLGGIGAGHRGEPDARNFFA
jgi:hypothetical protein